MVGRSGSVEFETDAALRTCSAEDLMILKHFALRPRDVLDAVYPVSGRLGVYRSLQLPFALATPLTPRLAS
jgi:hypothetical protein